MLDQIDRLDSRFSPDLPGARIESLDRRVAPWPEVRPAGVSSLLIASDPALCAMLEEALGDRSIAVTTVTASHVRTTLALRDFDVILLDAAIDGADAFDLCREVSGLSTGPVIFMTRLDDTAERTVAIEIGAEDAVWRGSAREAVARACAVKRRETRGRSTGVGSLLFSGWAFDVGMRKLVSPSGATGWLRECDARLLSGLLENAGRCFSRKALAELMAGRGERNADTVDWGVRVYRLRRALDGIEPGSTLILNVRHRGYVIEGAVVRGGPLRRI